jgi:hypothetical protein
MSERPATEPTFTDTMQIGIVVPDLDAAIRTPAVSMASVLGKCLKSVPRTPMTFAFTASPSSGEGEPR